MDRGITFLKQDFGIGLLRDVPGALAMPLGTNIGGGERVMHPFTGIEITDKGIAWLSDWVGADPRGHRHGDPAVVGSLRPHRRQQLHQAGARDGEVEPGVDGGHGAVAVTAS